MMAQRLAQTRAGARGALLMYSCLPVSEFGKAWPAGVPVQVHGKEGDEFFLEDIDAARALVESSDQAELFLYPGTEHLFADSSLPAYDPAAAALLTERVLAFLDRVPAGRKRLTPGKSAARPASSRPSGACRSCGHGRSRAARTSRAPR